MFKKFLLLPIIFCFMIGISACNPFAGMQQPVIPKTTKEAYITIEAQFTGFVQKATEFRQKGLMNDEQYNELDDLFTKVDENLDIANMAIKAGDSDKAQSKLDSATLVLWNVRDILMEVNKDE